MEVKNLPFFKALHQIDFTVLRFCRAYGSHGLPDADDHLLFDPLCHIRWTETALRRTDTKPSREDGASRYSYASNGADETCRESTTPKQFYLIIQGPKLGHYIFPPRGRHSCFTYSSVLHTPVLHRSPVVTVVARAFCWCTVNYLYQL